MTAHSGHDDREMLTRAAQLLEAHLDDLVAQLVERYRDQLPGYRDIARASIEQNTRELLEVAARHIRRGGEPDAAAIDEVRQLARRWVAMDLQADAISQSFQLGAYELLVMMRNLGTSIGLTPGMAELAQDMAWKWSMLGASALGEAERDRMVAEARRDATRQAAFLRDLSDGTVTVGRLFEEAEAFGLDPQLPYTTVYATAPDPETLAGLERVIRESGATSTHRAVVSLQDRTLIAVTPARPRAADTTTVALGPAALLAECAASFLEARQVLDTATAFDLDGVVDLTRLGPLTLVAVGDDAARRLDRHLFGDVSDSFVEIERTVLALLDRDQSIEALAAELHLHRNTIRYRVTRFRDETGLDIRETRDLVTTWWLLMWRESQRQRH